MDPLHLRNGLVAEAQRLGFVGVGVTGIEPFDEARERGLKAVAAGRLDGMPWMTEKRFLRSANPAWRFPWAKSLVALAWPYAPAVDLHDADGVRTASQRAALRHISKASTDASSDASTIASLPASAAASQAPVSPGRQGDAAEPARGRVAAYACMSDDGEATDYHLLLRRRVDMLMSWLREVAGPVRYKRYIDHGWAIDRAVAERAGVGFCGKHAGLLTRGAGSYVVLASAVISLDLPRDTPSTRTCGSCRACIPACPTGAITAPGEIDARRCISYLTIEHEGAIDEELRPLMGDWVFGCDICQEACPVNHRLAPRNSRSERAKAQLFPGLVELLELSDVDFGNRFNGTPMQRSGRARLARNAAIALGNTGTASDIDALERARNDTDAAVSDAAAWAITRIRARNETPR